MATPKTTQDSSSSKRHFYWTKKVGNEEDDSDHDHEVFPTLKSSSSSKNTSEDNNNNNKEPEKKNIDKEGVSGPETSRRKLPQVAVARLRSVLTAFGRNRSSLPFGLGPRVVGTLFGSRRGHVHFVLQKDPNSQPAFLIELATPISGLVKEMASGLVRIALECDKAKEEDEKRRKKGQGLRLLEEPVWRTYCNGKKCGFATRRECGPKEWKILKAIEPISMGAGVLPDDEPAASDIAGAGGGGGVGGGELMYMRAKFERIVGSRDSEAFYMMNPDSNGAPELSIYLLRV
ncbi:hypothetical protein TIFTF001_027060 [Ficus carica]|uniref:Protein MIZU-KUSSEI 1 n=1 Tax=Ficus carica TaxID=3494 RepID=A0AA88DM93_FICCA|nr:hypothetical protein TIFTF001_027060 [Ficus carica]